MALRDELRQTLAASYTIEQELGGGGMSRVFLAARVQHPHIVPVHSAGETAGVPYYTMPFVEGESLRTKLARAGRLSIAETISVLRDVTRALAYAHAADGKQIVFDIGGGGTMYVANVDGRTPPGTNASTNSQRRWPCAVAGRQVARARNTRKNGRSADGQSGIRRVDRE
jgi:hypothetical protein